MLTAAPPKRYDGPTISQAARSILKGSTHSCLVCGGKYKTLPGRPWTVYASSGESGPHITLEVHQVCPNGHQSTTSCFLDLEGWRS